MKIAAIDIGSNAARLLIKEVKTSKKGIPEFVKLNLLRIPFRLGMDVFTTGKIGFEKQQMVLETMSVFAQLMKIYQVERYRACATSAMRDAQNKEEVLKQIKDRTGIEIDIISGDEEATLIYENHIAEKLDENFGYLYIDVGGGSTELTYYENGKMKYEHSFNIGTIRLLNQLVTKEHWNDLKEEIKSKIKGKKPIIAIGSGGNINKLFSISKTKEGTPLKLEQVRKYHQNLEKMTVEERMKKYNIREDRADVMVYALEIYTKVMRWAEISEVFVPKISLADGLIHKLYDEYEKEKKSQS